MLIPVSEITQITAHDWNVGHGYKIFVAAVTVHSFRALLESKRNNAAGAAIAIASDHMQLGIPITYK